MRFFPLAFLVLVLGAGFGCGFGGSEEGERPRGPGEPAGLGLPATFAGTLPCADCEGIRMTLVLRPDSTFLLRRIYEGQSGRSPEMTFGRWSLVAGGRGILLRGGPEGSWRFEFHPPDTVSMLDLQGHAIVSKLNYNLVRTASGPLTNPMLLRGTYSPEGGAAWFTECVTGVRFRVAPEGPGAVMAADYVQLGEVGESPVLATVEGHLVPAAQGETTGMGTGGEVLVVDRFLRFWPGQSCDSPWTTATLEGTYWKLVELGGRPVTVWPDQREPHFRLNPEDGQLTGSGGCNGLLGRFEVDGDSVRFTHVATTRMRCPQGMEQEGAFVAALEAANRAVVSGEQLRLYDGDRLLARFESRYLR